jgi:hypothetical protein
MVPGRQTGITLRSYTRLPAPHPQNTPIGPPRDPVAPINPRGEKNNKNM